MSAPSWESVKENAAPLQRGRNISSLEQVAAKASGRSFGTNRQTRDDTNEKINGFEDLVTPSEAPHAVETEDDPLMHWLEYIKFYQDTFPSDTHQQFLLMERCTRALVKMPKYSNDDRFIGVCAKYADKTKEPGQVFKYLHQQKVGGETALFWIAWAYVAEKDNDFPFAEQIYKKGMSKDAQPMNTLKVRHKQFQRRMSRHWLNSSMQSEQLDEYEETPSTRPRGALGGLSHDRVRRNDRGRIGQTQLGPRARSSGRRGIGLPPSQSRSNGANTNGESQQNDSFSIFVEEAGENAPNSFLDQPVVEHKRVIERQVDRRKENTLDAERWNERGALQRNPSGSSKQGRGTTRSAPPPFAVFVDEECAEQHKREENEQHNIKAQHRGLRDERTFRERTDEGVAEKLTKDPLRYVRDHSRLNSDLANKNEASKEGDGHNRSKSEKRNRVGFNKRLLKDSKGREQAFEEVRGKTASFTLTPADASFNALFIENSEMDLEASVDMSMAESQSESSQVSLESVAKEQPRKIQKMGHEVEGRVLFQPGASFEGSINRTNISTASSTVIESEAVGMPMRREEETINTKFAMKELSMMFSSPAQDEFDRKGDIQTFVIHESAQEVQDSATSYANIGDTLGTSMLDNSILNYEAENEENIGEQNPFVRTTNTPGFDKMALRELRGDAQGSESLSCATRPELEVQPMQRNPLQAEPPTLNDENGFQIYEDTDVLESSTKKLPPTNSFAIYDDNDSTSVQGPSVVEQAKAHGTRNSSQGMGGFTIFEDQHESDTSSENQTTFEYGNTATLSLFGDAVELLGGDDHETTEQSRPGRKSRAGHDTATASVFNEAFQDMRVSRASSQFKMTGEDKSSGFSIFVEENESDLRDESDAISTMTVSPREQNAVKYCSTHKHDIGMAIRRLQTSSSVVSSSQSPLLSLLSVRGKTFHLPHLVLPRELRSNHLAGKTKVSVGKHSGVLSHELGRGAYGVVALMEVHDDPEKSSTIAIKAQSPTHCLAWEFEVMRRLEARIQAVEEDHTELPFPRPLSFISLADGGILSMTAGSKSGLNLVDLSNIYQIKLGERVPEIVVFHYVSRMLRHVENLHWHGKILHCDVKPDNFVLCTSENPNNAFGKVECSDLMLVDFGRAVDLVQHATSEAAARRVLLVGEACESDMQCVAMRSAKAWSFDVDTFGVLSCIHVLLYGTHIKVTRGSSGRWRLDNALKRYWQKELWNKIFDTLLNLDEESGAAIGSSARSLRNLTHEVEAYLEPEAEKLQFMLERQVTLLPSSREQLA